jgi:predicted transglutaminase-like protease
MNIKQSLSTIHRILMSPVGHFIGYCPSSEEINNARVRSLANRLKAETYEETLTNILEWQERNLTFWTERQPILPLLGYIYVAFVVGAITASILFEISVFVLIASNIQSAIVLWFIQTALWLLQNTSWIIAILTACTVTILSTMISILHSNRKFRWREIPKGLKNIFKPSISIDFLLEKKLGVCRDYAKLTACLLSNIYPNAQIYFASAPAHVATGINIENRLYMLDQRLPILTKERWNDYRKPKKSDWIQRFDNIKKTTQKTDEKTFLRKMNKWEPDTEKLTRRMTELLNIREPQDDRTILPEKSISILWKNGTMLYEENGMTDYSLARFLEMRISDELERIDHVEQIEVSIDKNDLVFQIHVTKGKE